jgi:hypothetical protein
MQRQAPANATKKGAQPARARANAARNNIVRASSTGQGLTARFIFDKSLFPWNERLLHLRQKCWREYTPKNQNKLEFF